MEDTEINGTLDFRNYKASDEEIKKLLNEVLEKEKELVISLQHLLWELDLRLLLILII